MAPAQGFCCPISLVSSPPLMHCVCALVQVAWAVCLAVLGFLSLLPGAVERCAGVPPAGACILPLSPGAGLSQVWMLSGCCPVSSDLCFRISCICCIFKNIYVFGRRFPLSYSHRHVGSAPGKQILTPANLSNNRQSNMQFPPRASKGIELQIL